MDNKKIVLINLSTGRVGEVNSSLLGGMIITKIQLAAMSRADTKPEDRVDFFLYVDEFQHFATESFATILSEARKYRLCLTMANQYISQMEDVVREAVFGNVGTMITFRVGAADAGFLEKEFNPPFEVNDIINLDRQQIYLKMTIDGATSNPFSAMTLTVPEIDRGNSEKIIQMSREKYSRPRKEVEEKINKWSGMENIPSEGSESSTMSVGNDGVPSTEKKFSTFLAKSIAEKPQLSTNNITEEKKFSAPIVKNIITKSHPTIKKEISYNQIKPYTKPQTNVQVKKVVQDKPASNHPSSIENESKWKENPKRERKEIDKETLKDIIRKAVKNDKPDEKNEGSPQKSKNITTDKPVGDGGDIFKKETPATTHSAPREDKPRVFPIPSNHKHAIDISGRNSHKELKVVTPGSFKDLKEIHPHQKVEVREHYSESSNSQILPGETILFKKNPNETDGKETPVG